MGRSIDLGTGRLSWPRSERVTDRYGSVMLMEGRNDDAMFGSVATALVGKQGSLRAVVAETRNSEHIGDIFRGIGPTRPEVGDVVTLGTGTVFTDMCEQYVTIGLSPDDDRESDWLDPHALYRCHSQTVALYFDPESP